MRDSGPIQRAQPGSITLDEALEALAGAPRIRPAFRRYFKRRLAAQRKQLARLYARIDKTLDARRYASRGEEWLVDNRHVIEEALSGLAHDLPDAYVRSLPHVASGQKSPLSAVEALAAVLFEHGGRPLDPAWIEQALARYQNWRLLTIGELWALPAFLISGEVDGLLSAADALADVDPAGGGEDSELVDRIAAGVISLRTLAAHDWKRSFERLSAVEQTLRQDPAGAYAAMNFTSRDRYRQVVEELARGSGLDENSIARRCVSLARAAAPDSRAAHVGYWLISAGREQLEQACEFRPKAGRRLSRLALRYPTTVYFGLLGIFAAAALAIPAAYLLHYRADVWSMTLTLALFVVPATGLAVALTNGLVTRLVPPARLVRLRFADGIPKAFRTAVAVPVIFADRADVDHVFEQLEINFLANDDPQLVWVMLGDLHDAADQSVPGDRHILARAQAQINRLNEQYPESAFLFLCRPRRHNPGEGCWMGHERKRGKLMAFNQLLADGDLSEFTTCHGQIDQLAGVRYVITLDADTRLPPRSARQLVGALAHPLSRIEFSADGELLVGGYGIIQPRVEIDPDSTLNTAFTRIFSGDATIDLYTHASSDVYHDLFGEGIFAGKGIYDWRAFNASLAGRIPDNSLLSHDLLEGIYARTGLASDIVVLEEFPPDVVSWLRRQHRWVRGDWQLLPWLKRHVTTASGERRRNRLKAIHRWKILDNLRRSIQPPVVLALILIGFSGILPGNDYLWLLLFLLLPAAGLISETLDLVSHLLAAPRTAAVRIRQGAVALKRHLQHWLLTLVLLPYQSVIAIDAIGRTLVRLLLTRRHLLEWTAAAHVQRRRRGPGGLWRELWVCPALGATAAIALSVLRPDMLVVAAPMIAAWLVAPAIIELVERPRRRQSPRLDAASQALLRRLGRRTWLFFEQFVGPDTHWLAPDNYQEDPRVVLAERTSPTNIGMAFSSALVAHDFGWIDPLSLLAWLRNGIEGMSLLERYRGHWFNWYDIREMKRLEPAYVSTVDSGNLAASLIVLARTLDELRGRPPAPARLLWGLADTLALITETAQPALARTAAGQKVLVRRIEQLEPDYRRLQKAGPGDCFRLLDLWQGSLLEQLSEALVEVLEDETIPISTDTVADLRIWLGQLDQQLRLARAAIEALQPWLRELPALQALADKTGNEQLSRLVRMLERGWPPQDHARHAARAERLIERIAASDNGLPEDLAGRLKQRLELARAPADALVADCRELARWAENRVAEMDFRFLYDDDRHLFRIGYDVANAVPDTGCYDLLASEARLTSLVTIALGQAPVRHWLHLGRPFRRYGGHRILMSWGASLFEYLMPRIFSATPVDSLLETASVNAIQLHRSFAAAHDDIPWGIAESAYYQLDEQRHYAYRSFGVPGLGFRRDLGERLVISPYASIMALPYQPAEVVDNVRKFSRHNVVGLYGCYEAIDFGRRASDKPRRGRVVRAWMSHHQGMILAAIDNCLNDDIMVRRFQSDPRIAGVAMLLHERPPRVSPDLAIQARLQPAHTLAIAADPVAWQVEPRPAGARYCLLSNGSYSSVINSAGGGGSWWQDIAIDRWQPDPVTNAQGYWIYIAEPDRQRLFSVSADPAGAADTSGRTVFQAPHLAEFRCRQHELVCRMQIGIASRHDVEARKLVITNQSGRTRRLVVASFAELAMAPARGFERHPAFARLFVESECLPEDQTLVFRRRPRSSEEQPLYVGHALVASGAGRFGWETDRSRFIGRGGSMQAPAGLRHGLDSLSGTTGATVDTAMTAGLEISLEPYGQIEIGLLTGVARRRDELLDALDHYRSIGRIDWLFEQARMQSALELHHLALPPSEVAMTMRLMSALLEPRRPWRGPVVPVDEPLQALLWSRGISGDWPIVVVRFHARSSLEELERLVQAHTFLSGRQLRSDLVIIDEVASGYEQITRDRLRELIESVRARTQRVLAGHASVVPERELSAAQRSALLASAAVVLDLDAGSVSAQLQAHESRRLPPLVALRDGRDLDGVLPDLERPAGLLFDNGPGGFGADGREYVIHLAPGQQTPAPWSNVLANPEFGTLVTESGTSFTWAGNSSEYRLTPWPNDPVLDPSGEVIYLRDEETARVWTPTPGPRPGPGSCRVTHGLGYSRYERHDSGLEQRLTVHVDAHSPVKIWRLTLTNRCDWTRRITATCYLEWVLGNRRGETRLHLDCDFDRQSRALLAHNRFDRFAGQGHAFVTSDLPIHGFAIDREEFLGAAGSTRNPAALGRVGLSSTLPAGSDPCAALQVHLDIPAGASRTVHFVLGHGHTRAQALALARRFGTPQAAAGSLDQTRSAWRRRLERVAFETPDPSFNLLYNYWLPYQAMASRLWGRTGYYQSSGGFGFRDQLQDVLAMIWIDPGLTRAHLLKAAARQFPQGDVLHWWHESPLRGARTRCSDDLLWLPYVTAQYVAATGDVEVLNEPVAYLTGPELAAQEAERYAEFAAGEHSGTLYEHCCRAIDRAASVGPRGLPVIGSGDWNDGFNRVSTTGRGESVWLAWFLVRVLNDFAPCCEAFGEADNASRFRELADRLLERIETHAWDGDWYKRAWFDDGTPIGSKDSEECQIDLIAQTWSVLGPERPPERAGRALGSALEQLVDDADRLILLLAPPFDRSRHDPGYIRGYPPGIRENGAQYTHAATWALWAAARLGWPDQVERLLGLLDPVKRTLSEPDRQRYRLEPYVLAGDIYSQGDNRGRGGWSWYTGAAAWAWRGGLEAIFGLKRNAERLEIRPCLPPSWERCRVRLAHGSSSYLIEFIQEPADGSASIEIELDGQPVANGRIPMVDDGKAHRVVVRIRPGERAS